MGDFGDCPVACVMCGGLWLFDCVIDEVAPGHAEKDKLGAGQAFAGKPCRICGNKNYRMLVGPLFVPRPSGSATDAVAAAKNAAPPPAKPPRPALVAAAERANQPQAPAPRIVTTQVPQAAPPAIAPVGRPPRPAFSTAAPAAPPPPPPPPPPPAVAVALPPGATVGESPAPEPVEPKVEPKAGPPPRPARRGQPLPAPRFEPDKALAETLGQEPPPVEPGGEDPVVNDG